MQIWNSGWQCFVWSTISYNKSGHENDTRNDDISIDSLNVVVVFAVSGTAAIITSNSKYFDLHGKKPASSTAIYARRDSDCDFKSIFIEKTQINKRKKYDAAILSFI